MFTDQLHCHTGKYSFTVYLDKTEDYLMNRKAIEQFTVIFCGLYLKALNLPTALAFFFCLRNSLCPPKHSEVKMFEL